MAHLSRPERQRCSWGAPRESDGRAAAQPPYACTRTEKVPWRRCSCVHLAAPRCPRRPPACPGHRSRRQNSQQRKTGSYTALPVVTSWPPCPRRHSVEPPLTAPSAAMWSAHYGSHDPESTRCMECCAKRPALRSMHSLCFLTTRHAAAWCSGEPGGQGGVRRVAPTTSGAASRWSRWMPHPSARRQWPQVDHGSIPRGLHAHGTDQVAKGGSSLKFG